MPITSAVMKPPHPRSRLTSRKLSDPKIDLTQVNYKELNVLYEKYKGKGFEILAFPCNQFAGQEPGKNEEIQEVVCTMFKAEFPIFDKIDVNGKNAAPLY